MIRIAGQKVGQEGRISRVPWWGPGLVGSNEQVERLLPERLSSEMPNTITSRAELLADLDRVRACGVAHDREEFTIGISAVGAEIHDAGGAVAALSIPVPTARFADQEERLVEMLLTACAEVSASLGANGHAGS